MAYVVPRQIAIAEGGGAGNRRQHRHRLRAEEPGTDVRADQLSRSGEYAGHWVLVGGAILAMREVDSCWIANVIYLAFVLSGVVSLVIRSRGDRPGFQPG